MGSSKIGEERREELWKVRIECSMAYDDIFGLRNIEGDWSKGIQ